MGSYWVLHEAGVPPKSGCAPESVLLFPIEVRDDGLLYRCDDKGQCLGHSVLECSFSM